MSVSLTKYPVTLADGKVKNIFLGFSAVELEFQRSDFSDISVGSGIDSKIAITANNIDLTSSLNIGEWVYLYATGATYTYNISAKIVSVSYGAPNTTITIDSPYIENASTGYINYKQNWFLEAKLVNEDNNAILQYPQLIQNNGTGSGVVKINTSMLVDFLSQDILEVSGEVTQSRKKTVVMYREVWRENQTEPFILVDDTAIQIVYAAKESEPESFVNEFEIPRIYAGYPFSIAFLHSLENLSENRLSIEFDELDINKDNITNNNPLIDFEPTDYGFLQANFNDNVKAIENNTRFISFNINTNDKADYQTGNYDDSDYLTINTP